MTSQIRIPSALIFIIIFLISFSGIAQVSPSKASADSCKLKLIAQVKEDSIILRWAPDKASAWQQHLQFGYLIERYEIPDDTSKAVIAKKIISSPLKPLPKEEWINKFGRSNNLAIVAASQIYPELEAESGTNLVSIIQGNNKLITRHGFALFAADNDPQIASAEGLRYVDTEIKKNTGYLYKVYFTESIPNIYVDTALVFINTSEITQIPIAQTPDLISFDSKIELHWDAGLGSGFSAFHIERAPSGTSEFIRLNKNPFISFYDNGALYNDAFYRDSLPNYVPYDYRIIGITPFGDQSKPSGIVTGMAKDFTPPSAPIITGIVSEGKTALTISWKLTKNDSEIAGFDIGRARTTDGPFTSISAKLSSGTESYTDTMPSPHEGNFYVVVSVDTAGNRAQSLPFYGLVEDDTPPNIPIGLKGYIDTSSIVHLQWDLGNEPDLQGYRVYTANQPDHEFSILTPDVVQDTVFLDTIAKRTLTKFIYYRIAAVDNNYNHSDYSPWVQIRRLDVIPPVAPLFDKVVVNDTAVLMNWINSSSDDVREQILFRRSKTDSIWKVLHTWSVNEFVTNYSDAHLPKKTFFEYKIIAVDSSNLRSDESSVISVRTYDNGSRPEITDISLNYNAEVKANILKWKYNQPGEYSILVYRALPGKALTKFKMLQGKDQLFEDTQCSLKGEYNYALKAVFKDGGESPVSTRYSSVVE